MSNLPPPPAQGPVPPEQTPRRPDPWRKYLPLGLVAAIVLVALGVLAGQGDDGTSSEDASSACTTVDMEPLTGWTDPVTLVEVVASGPDGRTWYAWGIGDAVWVANGDAPDDTGRIFAVNQSARDYDPGLGAAVDVFQTGYADVAAKAEAALAGCA